MQPPAALQGRLNASFGLPPGRCTGCHKEHEGASVAGHRGAMPADAALCEGCHATLQSRLADTPLRNVASWADHPQFRPAIVLQPTAAGPALRRQSIDTRPRENSGLKFSHAQHLSQRNGVAAMAIGLPRYAGALGCADCHTPDADTVGFAAITMAGACADCHSLAFDRDGDTLRTLPHGDPAQVVGILRDFYLARPLRRRPGTGGGRQIAGFASAAPQPGPAGTARAIAAVFSRGGACSGCHAVIPPSRPGALDFSIAPVNVQQRYLPRGRFLHGRHATQRCSDCHNAAAVNDSATLMLPGVATCRGCHGNAKLAQPVAAKCDTCHGFHDGPAMTTL
jgi:predicted CXXCH cytochrome family protein